MKKIIITFLFLISSVFSFATINDNLNILKDEEKVEINEKVDEIKKEKDIIKKDDIIAKIYLGQYIRKNKTNKEIQDIIKNTMNELVKCYKISKNI